MVKQLGINILYAGQAEKKLKKEQKETFAEWTDDGAPADDPPLTIREDTVSTVYSIILETCKLTVTSSDVKSAYRLKTKRSGPRPILVTFQLVNVIWLLSRVDQIRSLLTRLYQSTSKNALQLLIRNYFKKQETWSKKRLLSQCGLPTASFLSDGLKMRNLYV